jgi:adenine-specific DNA-methyltransferase
MTQLNGKSMNIIEQNIEKLKSIFPEIFSEGKIDFAKLEEELGAFKEDANERYNFTWNGKSEAKKIALTPSTGTLRPCKDESKDWDTTQNLYIEGDNLEVLKLLQKSYHKKVKMIYIDPPYNTGKDFVYKDNFRDNIKNYMQITGQVDSDGNKLSTNSETNGRYHSDWLNMMYPRLKLARNLLKDDGVIFISIDDNEVANLRKLCDEIFGEDNFVAEFIWKKRSGANDAKNFVSIDHEYILCYSKYSFTQLKGIEKTFSNYKNPDDDSRGDWMADNLTCNKTASERPNLFYKLIDPKTNITYACNPNRVWVYERERMERLIQEEKIIFPKKEDGTPMYKRHKNEVRSSFQPISSSLGDFFNANSTKKLREILNGQIFDYPKGIELIEILVNQGSDNNDIILDFFSGSATTAHAVMKLNSEDDGNRKFICVQLPETTDEKSEAFKAGYKNICEIGKERIRRAGEKVKSESGKSELDIGFKVLKLDSSNIKSWDSDFENLQTNLLESVENIKSDRSQEDLVYEILLKYGIELTQPIEELVINDKKIYSVGLGTIVCCLDNHMDTDAVEKLVEYIKENAFYDEEKKKRHSRVVFKDSNFKDSVVKTNTLAILKQNGIDEVVSI